MKPHAQANVTVRKEFDGDVSVIAAGLVYERKAFTDYQLEVLSKDWVILTGRILDTGTHRNVAVVKFDHKRNDTPSVNITPTKKGFNITRNACKVCGEPPFGSEYACGHSQQ